MNNSKPSIKFTNVKKEFYLQEDRTFKELIPSLIAGKSWAKKHVVFKNLSFSVKTGESIGIVGENGAGKSTIMKLIAGVTYPTSGTVKCVGKIAPLIELSAGFHHELSGYENIFLNAAILGMHKSEIDLVLQDIIDFSEIEEFLHTPMKKYSTGMVMRLAFSIAIYAPADIYLIDEVLAVGDRKFQKKCLRKLREFKNDHDKIIVFVSHSQKDIQNFCDRVILVDSGKMIMDGDPRKVFEKYNSL